MIEVVGVTHHYGIQRVLKNVSLTVAAGELISVMGPNGMGKSTLLSILAGIVPAHTGQVKIAGLQRRSSVEAERAIRKQVYYLPDRAWLPLAKTPREFLFAVGLMYDVPKARLRTHAEALLELFELSRKGDTPIGSCSTGQQKKVAVCGALVSDVPVLLLDEPFSGGLDPSGLLALKRVLRRLANRGETTVVLTSPVPELIDELDGRVAVIAHGEIVACDTPEGLRRKAGATDKSLAEVLEHLIHPQTLDNLQRYFEECA